ncbi:putative UTP-glucose-1-phosphate uridylyltransferase [Lyophyllum shimeji]|uniref:UTP--glucose-1-phosphate uridylyltransferase n=1 Tax=Lyophyllum shimeji TaxID=47721 RepID=A0A9P3PKF8_LYOSH|nr:putative UTP-glucose-1-phosphate uridylyltransferase [Lyophyllum shimeji]
MSLLQESASPFRRIHRRAAKHLRRFTTGLESNRLRNEIGRLVNTVSDLAAKKASAVESQMFSKLLARYMAGPGEDLDWGKVKSPTSDQIVPYDRLPQAIDEVALLKQLAVLNVNGSLGTSVGMQGARSALDVKNDFTFLDLIVQQIAHVNANCGVDLPLLLMTSFNTHEDTLRKIQKYDSKQVRITPFMQSKYPTIMKDSLLPCPEREKDDEGAWYAPGHGDLYTALYHSGLLDRLLKDGKHYLFVSNSDNLGSVVDSKILQHMSDTKVEFLMEVTDKTNANINGGTLIDYDGTIRLLEIAQVPSEHLEEVKSARKFRFANTNNLWINLRALKKILDDGGIELDIIVNHKVMDDGRSVIQLETAAGSAIRHFSNTGAINVPRSRFIPVKNCSDLLLIKSDIYLMENGRLVLNEDRMFGTIPVIELDDHFKEIRDFRSRFKSIPSIIDLDHLTVSGNVYFGRDVTLRGTVIIVAVEGQRIDIPDGPCLRQSDYDGAITSMLTSLPLSCFRLSISQYCILNDFVSNLTYQRINNIPFSPSLPAMREIYVPKAINYQRQYDPKFK